MMVLRILYSNVGRDLVVRNSLYVYVCRRGWGLKKYSTRPSKHVPGLVQEGIRMYNNIIVSYIVMNMHGFDFIFKSGSVSG